MKPSLRLLALAAFVTGTLGLAGCSSIDDQGPLRWLAPYRMEVVQGNVVTSEMLAQVRQGQTREQVRMLLGSPLLTDLFHADRWDYVFTIRRQGAPSQQRHLTVFFNADRVQRFQAADLPDEKTFVASIEVDKPRGRRTPLELDEAALRALPLPAPRATATAPAASAPAGAQVQRNYPPLESGPGLQ
jgi:outer membrane protein assembly factor BamE